MYLDFDDGSGRSIDETIELEDEEKPGEENTSRLSAHLHFGARPFPVDGEVRRLFVVIAVKRGAYFSVSPACVI